RAEDTPNRHARHGSFGAAPGSLRVAPFEVTSDEAVAIQPDELLFYELLQLNFRLLEAVSFLEQELDLFRIPLAAEGCHQTVGEVGVFKLPGLYDAVNPLDLYLDFRVTLDGGREVVLVRMHDLSRSDVSVRSGRGERILRRIVGHAQAVARHAGAHPVSVLEGRGVLGGKKEDVEFLELLQVLLRGHGTSVAP